MSQPQARPNHHANHGRKRPRNNHRNDRQRGFKPNNNVKDTVSIPLCSVCQQEPTPKYKCPKCRATYCSIACCRHHKEGGCSSEPSPPAASEPVCSKYITDASKLAAGKVVVTKRPDQDNGHADDWEEGWKINSEMKTRLRGNDWLHQELRDVGLRQLMVQIYEASNAVSKKKRYEVVASSCTEQEQMLDKIKEENPQFQLFLDKVLLIAGVLEYSGKVEISELLSRDLNDLREHLTLAPSQRIVPASDIADGGDSSDNDGVEDSSSESDSTSVASSSSDSDTA